MHIFIKMTAKLGQIKLLQNIIYSINQNVLENNQEELELAIEEYKTTIKNSVWLGNESLEKINEFYKTALEGKLK